MVKMTQSRFYKLWLQAILFGRRMHIRRPINTQSYLAYDLFIDHLGNCYESNVGIKIS
ncbi:hypothetical protein DSUL_80020 [Desulfovibrionales bacterium]